MFIIQCCQNNTSDKHIQRYMHTSFDYFCVLKLKTWSTQSKLRVHKVTMSTQSKMNVGITCFSDVYLVRKQPLSLADVGKKHFCENVYATTIS